MNQNEILKALNEDSKVSQTEHFEVFSDLNSPKQKLDDYINSFHNLIQEKGIEYSEKKLITLFRINPLLAMRIIETSSISSELSDYVYYVLKCLIESIEEDYYYSPNLLNVDTIVLNNNISTFTIFLIEALFSDTYYLYQQLSERVLDYVYKEEKLLHDHHKKPMYLTEYYLKHIFNNIPQHHQIDLISWFWDKHMYSFNHFHKKETYASRRVDMMMNMLADGALWMHKEDDQKLSERERHILNDEMKKLEKFVVNIITEENHLHYIKKIFDKKTDEKIMELIGEIRYNEYKKKSKS